MKKKVFRERNKIIETPIEIKPEVIIEEKPKKTRKKKEVK